MMEKLAEFKRLLQQRAKAQVPIQTEWVKVKSVDWDEKTMVATGELNGLDYDDVLLGLGSHYRKPVTGSLATIGIIANSAACFMIDCEEVEEIEISDQSGFKWHLKDGKLLVKNEQASLFEILKDLAALLKQLKVSTPNGPSGTPLPPSIQKITKFETDLGKLLK